MHAREDAQERGGDSVFNKILLAAIALGIWVNALVNYVHPARTSAELDIADMAHDIHEAVVGMCMNRKIC
jgi:hypothetical protein